MFLLCILFSNDIFFEDSIDRHKKYQQMTFSNFINIFFCKKLECLSKLFGHVLLHIHVMHQITPKIRLKNVLFTN
jgi:hypothetical protein